MLLFIDLKIMFLDDIRCYNTSFWLKRGNKLFIDVLFYYITLLYLVVLSSRPDIKLILLNKRNSVKYKASLVHLLGLQA